MPRSKVDLPPEAIANMAAAARSHLPPGLQENVADPGMYLASGLFGAGPGWYHFGTPDNQVFLGHEGEADFYVLDFGVTATGTAELQGFDVVTSFERELDGVIPLNFSAEIAPGEINAIVVQGSDPRGPADERLDFSLEHLEFTGGGTVSTPLLEAGSLQFSIFA